MTQNKNDPPVQKRWFVVTQWNIEKNENDYLEIMANNGIRYLAYGDEICPTSGKPHHQMFIYLSKLKSTGKKTLGVMGGWFGTKHCYVKPMYKSAETNESYCSKEGSYHELGDKPAPGTRTDLVAIRDSIMAGEATADELCIESPHLAHQYGRTMDRLETIYLRSQCRHPQNERYNFMTTCTWYTGPSGAGKSHVAFEGYSPKTHYVKSPQTHWWCGYKQQATVILNDYRGGIPFSELLTLIDKWPADVEWRGKEKVPFVSRHIIITSVKSPEEVYKNILDPNEAKHWLQWTRRVKTVTLNARPLL